MIDQGEKDARMIEFNPRFREALELMENTSKPLFITGRAGTGKSTLLRHFRDTTRKQAVFLAPTGVAAVNIRGQTIHSFFGFRPDVTPAAVRKMKGKVETASLYRNLMAVVIDEVSMLRADLLDCVDAFLRLHGPSAGSPFGGVQVIFIGDLYQLPPVVASQEKDLFRTYYDTPFFFSAKALQGVSLTIVELEKVYRQTDESFIRLLDAIRNRTVTDEDLELLNRRCDPEFTPPVRGLYIHLTSTNDLADAINKKHLDRLKGKTWAAHGLIDGEFEAGSLPTSVELNLKKGAQVMLLNNDPGGRWVNGTIGRVTGFARDKENEDVILARLDDRTRVEIHPYTWQIFRYILKEGELVAEPAGSFTQYPVKAAFAVTIHKSQGKTFSRAVIDVGRGTFAHGQMYVALSRCRSLDGIVLKKPVKKSQILMDWRVVNFVTKSQYGQAARQMPLQEKVLFIEKAIREKALLDVTYLKAKDEKSRRIVQPIRVEEMEFAGRPFMGLEAWCRLRGGKRVFNVEKILEVRRAAGEESSGVPRHGGRNGIRQGQG